MTDPKTFPIQDYCPIPWELIAPHEAQAVKNHGGQTLQRLAERGGLSPCEALCAIRGEGIGRLMREPHGLRRDAQSGETICRCTCMHDLDDIVRKHRHESSAPSDLERLRKALCAVEKERDDARQQVEELRKQLQEQNMTTDKRLYAVSVQSKILVLADSREAAEEVGKDVLREVEEWDVVASPMRFLPTGWTLKSLPYEDDPEEDVTVDEWIRRGAAPEFKK